MSNKIETLAEYKKAMKAFVRGIIKAKIFAADDGKVNFNVSKCQDNETEKFVVMSVESACMQAEFSTQVSTRVFNKIEDGLYSKTIEQFNKLKGFAGMTVNICDGE